MVYFFYVLIWSQEWKLNLNADKCKVFRFSTWSNYSTWQPTFFIDTQKIWVNITLCLLGVILDKSLKFNAHLKKLTTSLYSNVCIIRATPRTSLGWRCSTLKIAFHTLIRNKPDYAAPIWLPWLSTTNLSCLDRVKNCTLWPITDQLVSTPVRSLCLELPYMQQPFNPESSRKGIMQHWQSS